MWQYHDNKMIELKKVYNKTSKQTQNRLQEIFDSFNITFDNLYNIADTKTKKKVNAYIEEWKDKGLLTGYFGMLANNIYIKTRVKNSEILELMIYSAYIEEQNKLQGTELNTFKDVTNYYYQAGQQEVLKAQNKKKKASVIPDAIFLALLDMAMYNGFTWEQYVEATLRYNSQQLYRQAIINIQQQKELEIQNNEFQRVIQQQNNQRLSINGNKISGAVDLTLIGMNNEAKVEGISNIDDDAKVRFIAVEDKVTTPMCHSLNEQIFKIHDWNEFERYSKTNDSIIKCKCYGLIVGLNCPPVNDHFHWCRSTITYQVPPIENKEKIWYNKLGNSNKNGIGGSGKGVFIEKISQDRILQKLKEYEDQIRDMKIEYGIVIDKDGKIYAYSGTETNLDITDRKLDNTIITHNHSEIGSFGKDDFNLLYENPNIEELRAVDSNYDYSLKPLKKLDMTYNEIYKEGSQLAFDTGDEIQHCTMEVLKEKGYIEYERRRKGKG